MTSPDIPLLCCFFLCIFSNAIDTDVFVIMDIRIIDINIANSNKEQKKKIQNLESANFVDKFCNLAYGP